MPLDCHGLHDWSLPFTLRTKPESGRITRLKRVKECLFCGKQIEVFDEPRINYPSERIQSFRLAREALLETRQPFYSDDLT